MLLVFIDTQHILFNLIYSVNYTFSIALPFIFTPYHNPLQSAHIELFNQATLKNTKISQYIFYVVTFTREVHVLGGGWFRTTAAAWRLMEYGCKLRSKKGTWKPSRCLFSCLTPKPGPQLPILDEI